ncbi:MAG: outer membrane lipoprotein carrier protein LolA [candidate division Zixibacteria bacterium]|nr:outer membrane lipoprotein carrier protein LolA [candidate division Zixibacteria bacterium]
MNKTLGMAIVVSFVIVSQGRGDSFDSIKKELSEADCVRIEFLSVLESKVFETVDTMPGTAHIAEAGSYRIQLGPDWFLYDGTDLYSYSFDNNQVTIEKVPPERALNEEISFLTRLDEFYKSYILTPGSRYRLIKQKSNDTNIPDSMIVMIDAKKKVIERVEYLDENSDRNVIHIISQNTKAACKSDQFKADISDSCDVVRIN